MSAATTHYSPFAGSWYPGDAGRLRALIAEQRESSEKRTGPDLLLNPAGFVVPHAGLTYSGAVASAAYRNLARCRPQRIVVLGFAHRGAPPGLWIPDVDVYETPLGKTRLDRAAVGELQQAGPFEICPEASLCDHSVEIQLPFLQEYVPDAMVVPVYVSGLEPDGRRRAAKALASLMDSQTVLLASSDFTHYGQSFRYTPFPVTPSTPRKLRSLDEGFMEAAGSLEANLLFETLGSQSATVCGREPIALMLETIRAMPDGRDYFQRRLDYQTSGEITGDYSHCVSYAALGYFPWRSFRLSESDGQALLGCARATIRQYQETGRRQSVAPAGRHPVLERKAGAFVTLRQGEKLRGCVGRITAGEPLSEVVPQMALAAAFEDSRFQPLGRDEPDIQVEVSLLSPMKRLPNPAQFRIGVDGGYLQYGGLSGLLLPQVAEGRDWTAADFLTVLSRKARLADDGWQQPDVRLFVFRAQVIA